MADCTSPTLSVPDLTCTSDLPTWATALVASAQAAIDHVVGCIQDFEYPQCDICVLKDDLVNCPLDVDMMDFTDIAWADEGGIGVLPYPPQAGDYEFRSGVGETTDRVCETGCTVADSIAGWAYVAIVFATPFPSTCVHVSVTPYDSFDCNGGICGDAYQIRAPWVINKSTTGCTVLIKGDEFAKSSKIRFTYLAAGY